MTFFLLYKAGRVEVCVVIKASKEPIDVNIIDNETQAAHLCCTTLAWLRQYRLGQGRAYVLLMRHMKVQVEITS